MIKEILPFSGFIFFMFVALFILWMMLGYPIYAMLKVDKMNFKKRELKVKEKELELRLRELKH